MIAAWPCSFLVYHVSYINQDSIPVSVMASSNSSNFN